MNYISILQMGKLRLRELKRLRRSCRDRASEGLTLLAGQRLKRLQRHLAVCKTCTSSGPTPQRSVLTISPGDCGARPSLRSPDGYLRSLGILSNCGLCFCPRQAPGFCIANLHPNNASAVGRQTAHWGAQGKCAFLGPAPECDPAGPK